MNCGSWCLVFVPDFWWIFSGSSLREIPPGLLQHVLTVLVFWSWVLLRPRLPPWSRSLRLLPWASIWLYGPLDIVWICCPQLRPGRTAHVFTAQGGTRRFPWRNKHKKKKTEIPQKKSTIFKGFLTKSHSGTLLP